MKTRPKYGFSKYSDSALDDKATLIYNMMSVNPQFAAPPIPYPTLLILIQTFHNSIVEALNRDKVKVSLKREARDELELALKTLAAFIMTVTESQTEIEQTGFDVVVKGAPVGVPGEPQNVRAGSAGVRAIEVEWQRVHGALNYILEMTTNDPQLPTTVWTQVSLPVQSKFVVENLNALTYYWFRVKANGAAGIGQPSAPVVGLSI